MLLLLCVCLVAPGCSVIRQDVGQPLLVDMKAIAAAPDYHHVLRILGPPHKLSRSEHDMTFLYEEVDLTERQVGFNLTIRDITLLKVVIAREFADRQVLVVTFDVEGNTRSFGHQKWSDIVAEGAALQFVFVIAGVADEGDLNDSPAVHQWGFGLLEADLARLLNRQNRLDTGGSGVEQKGTPTAAGQHTLELR
jgi:hypothetical protein